MIPNMPRNAGSKVRIATTIALGLEKAPHSIKAVRNAPKITKNIFHLFQILFPHGFAGTVRLIFDHLAQELELCTASDASACMETILADEPLLCEELKGQLMAFGVSLGYFDLAGQQQELRHAINRADNTLKQLSDHRSQRLRTYQTLGLCAGAALAILLL